jgi:RNA polymerase sigma-70 factor, ECF subfamily
VGPGLGKLPKKVAHFLSVSATLPGKESVLDRAVSPDRHERFLALFLPCQGDVRAFVRSILWDRSRCDDVFQEVALVLWRQFERYDPARSSFGAWARGVAANVVLKHLERDRRAPVPLSIEAIQAMQDAFDHVEGATDSGAEEALRACLQRLPQRSQTLVQLRYRHALKLDEIAAQVKSTPDAVHKALARVRAALQDCIQRRLRVARGAS